MTVRLVLIIFSLALISGSAHAETLNCTPEQKFVCSPDGCKTAPAKVRAIIDMDNQTYSRCDSLGCDQYEAEMSVSGIYLNVAVRDKSVAAKVEIPSLGYLETVSLGHAVYNSFGSCSRK